MASEYLKWLARDEKPEPKRELTPKEKRKNWWYYHKWHVVVCVLAVLFLAAMAWDIIANRSQEPDYQVAHVGSTYLPDDTVTALQNALADLGEDLNGDGQVLVRVNEYLIDDEMTGYAGQVQLSVDISDYDSFIFLMEDPARFQEQFELLAYPDGTVPEEGAAVSENLWYSWTECPVLTALPLGGYTLDSGAEGDNQKVLSELYIARRAYGDDHGFRYLDGNIALWEKMTEGIN